MLPPNTPGRRWVLTIAQLRHRAAKARRASANAEAFEIVDEALTLCDSIVRELAGTGMAFDEYKLKLDAQSALTAQLFDEMPIACVETDPSGVIRGANREAGRLFNTSGKHLAARLLLHFSEDREHFGRFLRTLSGDCASRDSLVIRPRERAPLHADVTVIPRVAGDPSVWLWFFTPNGRVQATKRRQEANIADGGLADTSLAS